MTCMNPATATPDTDTFTEHRQTQTDIHTCIHTYIHIHIHRQTYIHTYIHIHTHRQTQKHITPHPQELPPTHKLHICVITVFASP